MKVEPLKQLKPYANHDGNGNKNGEEIKDSARKLCMFMHF